MRVHAAASPYLCQHCKAEKFMDGRLTDWMEPFLTLEKLNWRPDPTAQAVYGGSYDLSATVRLAWNEDYLYVAVVVVDDFFTPAKKDPIDTGDAVLLRLTPAEPPNGKTVTPTELVLTFNGVAIVGQRKADGTLAKTNDIMMGVARRKLSVPHTPIRGEDGKATPTSITKIWYELAIPWQRLPDIAHEEGSTMGVEIHIIDNDGQGVRGRLKWRGEPGVPRTLTDLGQVRFSPPQPTR
ncbi:MAG: DOMON domain-containing protein [Armatimonadota bacterium]